MGNIVTSLLSTLAPTVASALLGPLGGVAVAALGKIFNVSEPTIDTIGKVLQEGQMTPDHVAQIKQLELQYQNDEKEREFKYKELEYADSKSARDMQISTHSNTPSVLTYLITIGFFGILGYMLTDTYEASQPLLVMLGSLGTAWIAAVQFWFGSSHGSQNKDFLLAASQPPSK